MRTHQCVKALVVVMAMLAGTSHAQTPASSTAVYSCTDASGRRLTADRPIDACADREQKVMLPGGAVRIMGPIYSEQERAEQAERQRREAEERYRANDGKRRERALAVRFPNKAAHDVERAEAVNLLNNQIKVVHERKLVLQGEREEIDKEMEFYKKDPSQAPPLLHSRWQSNQDELKELDAQTASLNEDIKLTHQRFDEEAKKLQPYWTPASK